MYTAIQYETQFSLNEQEILIDTSLQKKSNYLWTNEKVSSPILNRNM
jgi:hypothetical protein